jgi:hypothetical protein
MNETLYRFEDGRTRVGGETWNVRRGYHPDPLATRNAKLGEAVRAWLFRWLHEPKDQQCSIMKRWADGAEDPITADLFDAITEALDEERETADAEKKYYSAGQCPICGEPWSSPKGHAHGPPSLCETCNRSEICTLWAGDTGHAPVALCTSWRKEERP